MDLYAGMLENILPNEYERAFRSWLTDNGVQHVVIDQRRRQVFARCSVKTFDLFLYPPDSLPVVAEVKGRRFTGKTLSGLRGFECWVTIDDVAGLDNWQTLFTHHRPCRTGHSEISGAVFVFAYRLEDVDIETDGVDAYDFEDRRYAFYIIRLDDYRAFMKVRSPGWKTVTLPAESFRRFAVPARQYLLGLDTCLYQNGYEYTMEIATGYE